MTYLKSCLKGKAADVIKGFKVSSNDYKPALQTIRSNFAYPKHIKRVLVRKLLNIKAPRYTKTELCHFRIEYETLIRSIASYESDTQRAYWLIQELMQIKLPVKAEKFIFQQAGTKYFNIREMSNGLKGLLDYMGDDKPSQESHPSPPDQAEVRPKYHHTPKSNTVGTYQVTQDYNTCLLCDQAGHKTMSCKKTPPIVVD